MNFEGLTPLGRLLLLFGMTLWWSAEQAEAVCTEVKIEIVQEATFERIAFDARMAITNNDQGVSLTDVRVDVSITDAEGNPAGDLFYVRVSDLKNISDVQGTGVVAINTTAEVHWLIIPSPGAGGEDPFGKVYDVGATLTYKEGTQTKLIPIRPDQITVMPQPELTLDYFMPSDVVGDDPYTSQVEPAEPFSLGLRVKNSGYGDAWNFKIQSAQPKIIDNKDGLLVDFEILSAQVNDQPTGTTLLVGFGDVLAQETATARWEMIATLSGKFKDLKVEFEHASELGGALTSLIQSVNGHYLVHEVKVGLTGSDNRLDFLSDDTADADDIPEMIFDSQGRDYVVNHIPDSDVTVAGYPSGGNPTVSLTLNLPPSGWVYAKVDDPGQGLVPLSGAIRGDGVYIDSHNVWISQVKKKGATGYNYYLNILDYREASTNKTYTFQYQDIGNDTTAPVTKVVFGTPSYSTQAKTYVTPATQIVFTADDDLSGVAFMEYKVDAGGWQPAYPLDIEQLGDHQVDYRSKDRAGNLESARTLSVFVDDSVPVFGSLTASPPEFSPGAPGNVGAMRSSVISATVTDDVPDLDITLEIARGQGAFNTLPVIRTLTGKAASGASAMMEWDGKDAKGVIVSPGIYSVRMRADDHLGHTAEVTGAVTVSDFNRVAALDPNLSGEQEFPEIYGNHVVWQDNRNGDWDVYHHDLSTAATQPLVSGAGNQEKPAIYGSEVVWQDNRNGDYDIYRKSLAGAETGVYAGPGDQINPSISDTWIVWQGNQSGYWNIYAYRLSDGETRQLTSDIRDQVKPKVSGETVVWEDYRHGLGEIYVHDLSTSTQTRITNNNYQQMAPAILNGSILWTDQRDGSRDIHYKDLAGGQDLRLNYEPSDQDQAAFNGTSTSVVFYTDYSAGLMDPNVALLSVTSGIGYFVSLNNARQEEPAAYDQRVVWQDNRDGVWQIYSALVQLPTDEVQYEVVVGFNNMMVTDNVTAVSPDAFSLLSAWEGKFGLTSLKQYDPPTGVYRVADYDMGTHAASGDNFTLESGKALLMTAGTGGIFVLGQRTMSNCSPLTLEQGFNNVGTLCLPSGYSAYDFINSVGKSRVISIQQLDKDTGLWRGASVRDGVIMGDNFVITPGEGIMVQMLGKVYGWTP